MKNSQLYRGFRYPCEIISHVVWLYFRFSLSFRDIEELMASRGIIVTYGTVNLLNRRSELQKPGEIASAGKRNVADYTFLPTLVTSFQSENA